MTTTVSVSSELQQLINEFASLAYNAKDIAAKIEEQAKSEGLSNKDLRELIESALKKRGLKDRTIREALPDYLKDTKKATGMRKRKEIESTYKKVEISNAAESAAPEPINITPPRKQESEPKKEEPKIIDAQTIEIITAKLDVERWISLLRQLALAGKNAELTIEEGEVTVIKGVPRQ